MIQRRIINVFLKGGKLLIVKCAYIKDKLLYRTDRTRNVYTIQNTSTPNVSNVRNTLVHSLRSDIDTDRFWLVNENNQSRGVLPVIHTLPPTYESIYGQNGPKGYGQT